MVWGGDVTNTAHTSTRSNVDLEIGCLIDLATGMVNFTVNGKEISTSYQVLNAYIPQTNEIIQAKSDYIIYAVRSINNGTQLFLYTHSHFGGGS